MPLLDHFHPSLSSERRWESFHSSWATRPADALTDRPLRRGKEDVIDVRRSPLALSRPLPTLPLGLRADLAIPVDFEETYAETCLRKRLTGSGKAKRKGACL